MQNFEPYDIYERHKRVGSMIGAGDSILDVGGQLGELSKFTQASKITVANLKDSQEKSDIKIEKGKLPFKSGEFSTVCAIDVLEHMRYGQRLAFIKELLRVASKKIILSFPIGTREHIVYERQMTDWLKKKDRDITYLEEHITFGLPTPQEAENFTKNQKGEISYSGDMKVNRLLFKIYLFDPKIKIIGKVVYFTKLIFNLLTNPILYAMLSKKEFANNVIRAYLVIQK